jgi:hypothetical protein
MKRKYARSLWHNLSERNWNVVRYRRNKVSAQPVVTILEWKQTPDEEATTASAACNVPFSLHTWHACRRSCRRSRATSGKVTMDTQEHRYRITNLWIISSPIFIGNGGCSACQKNSSFWDNKRSSPILGTVTISQRNTGWVLARVCGITVRSTNCSQILEET